MFHIHWIADAHLKPALLWADARSDPGHGNRHVERLFHPPVLLFDLFFVLFIHSLYGFTHAFFSQAVIGSRRQSHRDFVPKKICAGNLFEEAGARLKNNRVGKDDNSAGGLAISSSPGDLHQVQADESNVNHITGHAGYLYAITYPDSILADQKEITGNREDHILQRYRNPP